MSAESKVTSIRDRDPLTGLLQDELYAVICQGRFDHLSIAQTVGVLEFLKWNLINRSDC
jgi:hypothetical protein